MEVQVDDGPWQEAQLGSDVTNDAWRQWALDWDAKPGTYTIAVRATDKDGETQTAARAPDPDGATGYPRAPSRSSRPYRRSPSRPEGSKHSDSSADVDHDLAGVGVGGHVAVGIGDLIEGEATVDHRMQLTGVEQRQHLRGEAASQRDLLLDGSSA